MTCLDQWNVNRYDMSGGTCIFLGLSHLHIYLSVNVLIYCYIRVPGTVLAHGNNDWMPFDLETLSQRLYNPHKLRLHEGSYEDI